MKASENAYKLIKEFEGLRLEAYKCPSGILTIGYGHTNVIKNMVITREEAEELLKCDVESVEEVLNHLLKLEGLTLNQNEFDALISFTFNCGSKNLKTLIKGRTAHDISDAILLYNKADGRVLQGLIRRREEEKMLFDTPVYEDFNFKGFPRYYINIPDFNTINFYAVDDLDSDIIAKSNSSVLIGVFNEYSEWLSTTHGWIYKKDLYDSLDL